MGQTLTHGVYLPDEGERNCYSGLAANWSILDGAVGTVAEHTTQIAGKAPAVHTHTKADITDFPAYGTTAGTICEGNDSRLSDARTPVAHTHTKSDVTDLLNSNFIPSANNAYDLGSASKQWLNTYSKGYYYNGVAWGLDKANVWTQVNYFTQDITINSAITSDAQSALSGTKIRQIIFNDSNNSNYFFRLRQIVDATSSRMQFNAQGFDSNNQVYGATFVYKVDYDGKTELYPGDNNQSLGNSSNKWKSFNGVNPGALSLPNFDNADPIDFSQWDVTGAVGLNYYTPAVDGWLNISIWDRATNNIFVYRSGKERVGVFGNGSMASDGRIALLMPVKANATYTIIIKASANSDIYAANFFPCLGNI